MTNNLFLNFSEIDEILEAALNNAHSSLSSFRNDAGYSQKLETAFGNGFDWAKANELFDSFAQGDFGDIPNIEIVNRNDINGANGAFSITTGKIYLAAEFISQNAQNRGAITAVLLEEIGHFVDARINVADAAGDEGDIFARLVQGESLSQQELAVLRTEDDSATVMLDGQVVEIEQNAPIIVKNNNDSGEGSLRQAILNAATNPGRDYIDLTKVSGSINLVSSLPTLNANNWIDFIDDGNTTINGQGLSQIITLDGFNGTFFNLTFARGYAKGGDANYGGGGGLGAGGALLIMSGAVTLDNVRFSSNQAYGGSGSLSWWNSGSVLLANGGNLDQNGTNGGQGGGFNITGAYTNAGGLRGSGGQGYTGSSFNPGSNGQNGGFGTGGGGGGGGAGAWGGDWIDSAGDGGNGGNGGFGGGGGGGGGGGYDYDLSSAPEHGKDGGRGEGGQFGTNGNNGAYRKGGFGGGGAGLGGAIFVNSGASLKLINSSFTGNSVVGGLVYPDGNRASALGTNIFVRDGGSFNYQGSDRDDLLTPDINDDFYTMGSYTLDGRDGNDTLYAVAGVNNNPNITNTLIGGKGADTFLLNLKGQVKQAFNFNTEKLADFVNAVTINPSASNINWVKFATNLVLDVMGVSIGRLASGADPVVGPVAGWVFSSGRKLGELLSNSEASLAAIQAQKDRAKKAVTDFGTENWGEIFTQGNREKIVITDFQPGLDTLVLPSLVGAKDKPYSYNLRLSSSQSGIDIYVNYLDSSNQERSELFITLLNTYKSFGVDDATFLALVQDLRLTDGEGKFTGTISTFKQTLITGSDNADNFDTSNKSSFAADRIESFGGNDRVLGLLGDDIIEGGQGNDTLYGGFGIDATSSPEYRAKYQPLIDLYGNDGNDFLFGQAGNDTLYGESGNDILNGGNDSDELWGGEGSDVFLYDSFSYLGTDNIRDFNAQQGDKIFISKSAFTGILDKSNFSYNTNTNTLSFNGKNLAVLNANSGFSIQRDLTIEAAEIFEHGNYQGRSLTLAPGKYDINDLTNNGFGDNILSSLKLPNGWSMRLYHNSDFTGANKVYTSDTSFTGDSWNFNDNVSSLVVADGYAEVFEHGNYGGKSFKLAPGEYDFNHFANYSFTPQSISSLIIPDGWKITLYSSPYENTSRTIYQKVFNSSDSWLGDDGWNDRAYSLKVEAPQPVPALSVTNGTSTGTTGTSGNDNLVGSSGNDVLLGLGGQDTLTGGLGADKFRFNSSSERMDTITDFSRTQGDKIELFAPGFNNMVWTDGVSNALNPSVFSIGASSNSWTNSIIYNNSNGIVYFDPDAMGTAPQVALAQLSSGLNLTNQDFLVTWSESTTPIATTSTTNITGTTGTAGNDNLVGGSGNDTLLGLGGQDTLTGGLGADKFRFNSPSEGIDTITDFNPTQGDKIELSQEGFKNGSNWAIFPVSLTDNTLLQWGFSLGSAATDSSHRIIYNPTNGGLYFDPDGTGSTAQTQFAQLSTGLSLTNQSFTVF